MKRTKEKILDCAQELFNKHGVADVSVRRIASALQISHSNLIYHFKTKNEILKHLHDRLLNFAISENEKLKQSGSKIIGLKEQLTSGFRVLHDYRFFMFDLNYIMKESDSLHKKFMEVEQIRSRMYEGLIHSWIAEELMRKEEYDEEYTSLIKRIRILSDYWISSAQIYDRDKLVEELISEYVLLLMSVFYPYLTMKGKEEYKKILV